MEAKSGDGRGRGQGRARPSWTPSNAPLKGWREKKETFALCLNSFVCRLAPKESPFQSVRTPDASPLIREVEASSQFALGEPGASLNPPPKLEIIEGATSGGTMKIHPHRGGNNHKQPFVPTTKKATSTTNPRLARG